MKKENLKKTITMLIVLAMACALLSGCGSNAPSAPAGSEPGEENPLSADSSEPVSAAEPQEEQQADEQEESAASSGEASGPAEEAEEPPSEEAPLGVSVDLADFQLPGEDTKLTDDPEASLTIYLEMKRDLANILDDMSACPIWKEAEEYTGVSIELYASGSSDNAFNLMIASGDYPDIISGINFYVGGLSKAAEEEVIISLNDYIEEFAPNYMALLGTDESMSKNAVDDSGNYYAFYNIYTEYLPARGTVIRADLLDKLGLDRPETFEEFTDVALAFQNEGLSDPVFLLPNTTLFAGGYGTIGYDVDQGTTFLYCDGDEIKASFAEEGYRKYVELLAGWYEKGIINRDFSTRESSDQAPSNDGIITSGNAGVFLTGSSKMVTLMDNASPEGFSLEAIKYPRENAGDPCHFGTSAQKLQTMGSTAISTACENVELAVKWMDFWYSTEGYYIGSYGIYNHGQDGCWTISDDNQLEYTDLILNNPDGMGKQAARTLYGGQICGYFTQDSNFRFYEDCQIKAVNTWAEDDDTGLLPMSLSLTTEEGEVYAEYAPDICTYASTEILKFIVGDNSMETWDDFAETCKSMGLDKCIEAYQGAYDRYLAR